MNHEFSKNENTSWLGRRFGRGLSCCVLLFGVILGVAKPTLAAGCHGSGAYEAQQFEGGQDGRFAQFYLWTTGPVIRIYEGGRLLYFQAPSTSIPCDGPSCRGSVPDDLIRVPANHRLDRHSWEIGFAERQYPFNADGRERLVTSDSPLPSLPDGDDLLRPPQRGQTHG